MDEMEMSSGKKQGLYVSYNEGKNGPFDEAVRISNELGCLTWLDKSRVDPRHLTYPTEVFVRLKGAERYFRGTLLAIASRDALHEDFVLGEINHRPIAWRTESDSPQWGVDFQSVLFIGGLRAIQKPPQLENRNPPQHPTYVDL
jgi:hypothetical protein